MAILVIEDDSDFAESLKGSLIASGYETFIADSIMSASNLIFSKSISVIVADMMLGQDVGIEILDLIEPLPHKPPLIIITSFATKELVIESLNMGVFKFVEKPIKYDEFLHLVKDAEKEYLGRKKSMDQNEEIENSIKLNPQDRIVIFKGVEASLTEVEFKIVCVLVQNNSTWVSRDFLNDSVWNGREYSSRNIIDTHVSNLKKKAPFLSTMIKSQRGRGYFLDYDSK